MPTQNLNSTVMGTLVSDFCKTALKRLLVSNDTPSPKIAPAALNDAVNELNLICDSWNADGKMIYSQQFYNFQLSPGVQTYTIGPSNTANCNTGTQPRPSYLESAEFEQITSNPYIDLSMRVVSAAEWAQIVVKNLQSLIGFVIYMDEQYPVANLNIWPIPQVTANIVLTTWVSLSSTLSLNSVIQLPPGYARALSLDLSIALAPYYGKAGSPTVQMLSAQLAKIKRDITWTNLRGDNMRYSGAAQGAGAGSPYDAISDQTFN